MATMWYRLKDASEKTGVPEGSLRRSINGGNLPARKVELGKRTVWEIHQAVIDQLLSGKKRDDYASLYEEWVRDQKTGYHTGKPIGERGVQANEYGMEKFWHYLEESPSLEHFSTENVRRALSNVPVNYQSKNCHFSQRDQMHKALVSFYKLLIRKGLKSTGEQIEVKKLKPKRVFPPRKTILEENAFEELVKLNQAYVNGRSPFDVALNRMILFLLAMAGLRLQELINLTLDQVDLQNQILYVVDGKGHKDRKVGIRGDLAKEIQEWIKLYRPKSHHPNLLLQANGLPITKTVVSRRIKILADRSGIEITPHGLRRTFATLHSDKGIPLPHIQKLLGHSDIKTTMSYVLTDEKKAIDSLRNLGSEEELLPERTGKLGKLQAIEHLLK